MDWNYDWPKQMTEARAAGHGGLVRVETGRNGQLREIFADGAVYNHSHRVENTQYRDYWEHN